MISQNTRKAKQLLMVTTIAMENKKANNKTHARIILADEYSPFKYPNEQIAEGNAMIEMTQRKNKESGSNRKSCFGKRLIIYTG